MMANDEKALAAIRKLAKCTSEVNDAVLARDSARRAYNQADAEVNEARKRHDAASEELGEIVAAIAGLAA